MIIARHLGLAAYGQYASVYATVGVLAVLFNYGMNTWLMGQGKAALSAGIGNGLLLKSLLGAAWYLGVVVTAPAWGHLAEARSLIVLAALGVVLDGWTTLAYAGLKAMLRNEVTALFQVSSAGLLLLTSVLLTSRGSAVQAFVLSRTLVSLVVSLAALTAVVRLAGWQVEPAALPGLLREGRWFALSEGLAMVYVKADVALLGWTLGETAAGQYAPAAMLVNALFIIPNAVYAVLLPSLARLPPGSQEQTRRATLRASWGMGLLGLALTLLVLAGARPLIHLVYGSGFEASVMVLALLSPILLLKSLSFALGAVLTARGWQAQRVIVQLAVALVNLALNLVLITHYGVMGATIAYLVSEIVLATGYGVSVYRQLWTRPYEHPGY